MPPLPRACDYIWTWYWRIRRRKASGDLAAKPIEWPDIDAFARHARVRFTDWELEIIEMLDDIYMKLHAENS